MDTKKIDLLTSAITISAFVFLLSVIFLVYATFNVAGYLTGDVFVDDSFYSKIILGSVSSLVISFIGVICEINTSKKKKAFLNYISQDTSIAKGVEEYLLNKKGKLKIYLFLIISIVLFVLSIVFALKSFAFFDGYSGIYVEFELLAYITSLFAYLFLLLKLFAERRFYANTYHIQNLCEIELQKELELKQLEAAKHGQWPIPVEELYIECRKGNITDLSTSYGLEKAKTVLKNILQKSNLPQEYWELYCTEQAIRHYYAQGKHSVTQAEEEEMLKKNSPQKGKLSPTQQRQMELNTILSSKTGIEKRTAMLTDYIKQIQSRIQCISDGKKAMQQLGIIMSQSVYQEDKKDWAISGGIASGIAGDIAGISTAYSTMSENEQIESRNRERRASAQKTISEIQRGAHSLNNDINSLQAQLKPLYQYREEALNKVVMSDIPMEDLFRALSVNLTANKSSNGQSIEVQGTIVNNYAADVPDNVSIATDGILSVRILFNGQLVDTVPCPLPVFGIDCKNGKESVLAVSDSYVEADGNYTVEVSPKNLWLVEI